MADKLWSSLRRPIRQFYRFFARAALYQQLLTRNWEFWGPPEFITEVEAALIRLKEIDLDLWNNLGGADSFVLFKTGRRVITTKLGIFSIGRDFLDWGESGILAFCVYIYYRITEVERPELMTGKWLDANRFPEELSTTFLNYDK